ncbi:sialoadhesin-like [Archocentrus centrarchus]|uniref:sialoadhesin-like n=1 Tax=Archocentrus centrarchus TaxID=63155 RepID=UPI0011EA3281|nr:sialoadhesin-like [Archocentrus centrarchus]
MSAENNFTLTINSLTETDANIYCCRETADKAVNCQQSGIHLYVAELQVKVIPATEGQTVTLMCSSSSCPLTENPAAYIWYKNREFLYEDWSPWYQELLSSEEAVTYSCAVKGYEHLRAPEVSVASLTPACFIVTSAKGRMCSSEQTSVDESCTITYPTGVLNEICWSLNYVHSRICALEGSSVNISSKYSHPEYEQIKSKCWYKVKRNAEEEAEQLHEDADNVEYDDSMKNQHILTLKHLKKDDSAEYRLTITTETEELTQSDVPGVILIVTELRVEMSPSAVVTEGQRVTLTCRTSCPLTHNTNYIWYFNSRPLTPRENQNKHLILDPVSRENTGSYSCAVETNKDISSAPKTLTVQSITGTWTPAAAGGSAALLVLILLTVFCWIRKKRTTSETPRREKSENKQQMNLDPMYENISAQSAEQDDHHYSRLHFSESHTADLYSTIEPLPAH